MCCVCDDSVKTLTTVLSRARGLELYSLGICARSARRQEKKLKLYIGKRRRKESGVEMRESDRNPEKQEF